MEENYTAEEVQRHITACFHSYDICEELGALDSMDDEQQDSYNRNQEHIQLMLGKDWFRDGLTEEQETQLENYL
jgi:hypothetical protein